MGNQIDADAAVILFCRTCRVVDRDLLDAAEIRKEVARGAGPFRVAGRQPVDHNPLIVAAAAVDSDRATGGVDDVGPPTSWPFWLLLRFMPGISSVTVNCERPVGMSVRT